MKTITTVNEDQGILIFKTNIKTNQDVKRVQKVLGHIPAIQRWTIDLDDWEKVMKVTSDRLSYSDIESIIGSLGYTCCELDH